MFINVTFVVSFESIGTDMGAITNDQNCIRSTNCLVSPLATCLTAATIPQGMPFSFLAFLHAATAAGCLGKSGFNPAFSDD